MKKVTLTITSKDYTITLDDAFAKSFEEEMGRFFKAGQGIDTKSLLNAFVQKCYDEYVKDKQIDNILERIDDTLSTS